MTVMIDTHVLLWWLDDPSNLSVKAKEIIENLNNVVFVSTAVIWEVVIKKKLGKLQVPDGFANILMEENFTPLVITVEHALALEHLPDHHQDPFDRIQIAQAKCEGLTFLTRDQHILKYEDINSIKA